MNIEEILKLIEKISPQGRDYVYEGLKNKRLDVLYSSSSDENKCIFLVVNNEDCCIFFATFLGEYDAEHILKIIKSNTLEYLLKIDSKEVCFNVYGYNLEITKFIKELGFKVDMEGWHLEYRGKAPVKLNQCDLVEKGYEMNMIKDFVGLFDNAYYELCINNGWATSGYAKNQESFSNGLIELDKLNQVRSFWIDDELVGAYIFEDNYITDIVVKPSFQNKGYGSYILNHCIKNMIENKSIKNIRLRVAKSNIRAKKLYERNNFVEIACFAEHTMKQIKGQIKGDGSF